VHHFCVPVPERESENAIFVEQYYHEQEEEEEEEEEEEG
jgi:hypothetical protein